MRYLLLVCHLLLVGCDLTIGTPITRLSKPMAMDVSGQVLVTMPGGAQRPLRQYESIPVGAKLETGDAGELLIALQPGISVLFGNNTRGYVSQWKAAPSRDYNSASDNEILPSEARVTLTSGELCAVIEKGTKFDRILRVDTIFGRFESSGGSFTIAALTKSIQIVTVLGFLDVDTQTNPDAPVEATHYKLEARRSMLIPESGELQELDPATNEWKPKSVVLLKDDDAIHYFSHAAVALLESMSHEIISDQMMNPMIQSLVAVGKAGSALAPVVLDIGQQLEATITSGRVSPTVAQGFMSSAVGNGIPISNETSKQVQQALKAASDAAVPHSEVR